MDKDTKNTNNVNNTNAKKNIKIALTKAQKIKHTKYRGWYFVKTY